MLAISRPGCSQILYENLLGNITDPHGAAVPGAAVTIVNIETDQPRGNGRVPDFGAGAEAAYVVTGT